MARPLGSIQRAVLRGMVHAERRNDANRAWFDGCGWVWSTAKETARLMESLHRRGLLDKTVTHVEASPLRPYQGRAYDRIVYSLNDQGRETAEKEKIA